jgi:hypothetical protein
VQVGMDANAGRFFFWAFVLLSMVRAAVRTLAVSKQAAVLLACVRVASLPPCRRCPSAALISFFWHSPLCLSRFSVCVC